ncbi:hypothetical protein KY312_02165, partial [Candidatus Woesearchaeota archaeon]|nr:hypothetical protein [Candidatus Woesearchaeota archaeon]
MKKEPTLDEVLKKLLSMPKPETDDASDLAQKGLEHIEMLDFEKGSELIQQAFELDQSNALVGIATKYISNNDFKSAKTVLKKGLEKNPDDDLLYAFLGMCYMRGRLYENLEDLKEAEKGLKCVFDITDLQKDEITEADIPIFRCMGLCYLEQGKMLDGEEKKHKLELAEAIFQKLVSSNKVNNLDNEYLMLADCYGELGKKQEWKIYLKKAF